MNKIADRLRETATRIQNCDSLDDCDWELITSAHDNCLAAAIEIERLQTAWHAEMQLAAEFQNELQNEIVSGGQVMAELRQEIEDLRKRKGGEC